jgi:hypothetical protein
VQLLHVTQAMLIKDQAEYLIKVDGNKMMSADAQCACHRPPDIPWHAFQNDPMTAMMRNQKTFVIQ